MKTSPYEEIKEFSLNALSKTGVALQESEIITEMILDASLDGIDTHGLTRLPIYITHLMSGKINPNPHIIFSGKGAVLNVDGDNALGQLSAYKTIHRLIDVADKHGIGVGFIKNSNHLGALSSYCKIAAKEGKLCIGFTNSTSGIPPWGGIEPYFGTNPIAFGFPHKENEAIIVDLSSSVTARGNIILAEKSGEEIPDNWALDQEGNPTTVASEALKGSVLPVGGGKGYALAFAVEMMAGVLSGAAFGSHVGALYNSENTDPINVGQCFFVVDLAEVMDREDYEYRMETMIQDIKRTSLRPGFREIRIPGERRMQIADERFIHGIPIDDALRFELNQLAEKLGISPLNVE